MCAEAPGGRQSSHQRLDMAHAVTYAELTENTAGRSSNAILSHRIGGGSVAPARGTRNWALKQEFGFDDAFLEGLREELIFAKRVAAMRAKCSSGQGNCLP